MIKKETDIMIEKKFNFVYITTNLINEKQYIGDHSAYDLNCAYTKRYIGSGTGIKNAVKKYGKENFKRDILEFFLTKQEAYNAQELYIKKFNTLYPNGYNNNQKGGYGVTGLSSKEKSIKLSKIHKGKTISEKHKNAIREFMKTFKHTEETKQKMRKPKSEAHKKKISEVKKGIICSEETKRKMSLAHIGRKLTKEAKKKISESNTGNYHTEESKQKMRDKRNLYWENKKIILT